MSQEITQRTEELKLLGWTDQGAKRYADLLEQRVIGFQISNTALVLTILILSLALILVFVLIRENRKNKKQNEEIPVIEPIIETNTAPMSVEIVTQINTENTKKPLNELFEKIVLIENNFSLKPLASFLNELSIDTDAIFIHILLISFLLIEPIANFLNIRYDKTDLALKGSNTQIASSALNKALSKKTVNQLRDLVAESELLTSYKYSRKQLVELVTSSPNLSRRVLYQERKLELMNKKNDELKNLLKGKSNISRLKKRELVEQVLLAEYGSETFSS